MKQDSFAGGFPQEVDPEVISVQSYQSALEICGPEEMEDLAEDEVKLYCGLRKLQPTLWVTKMG